MEWLSNEVLFYGGIVITVCSILGAIFCFFISRMKEMRLKEQLDAEYGKEEIVKKAKS